MTKVDMTVRADCAVSACSPVPLSIKVLAHLLSVGGISLWTDVHPSHTPLTSICCLVAKLGCWPAGPQLGRPSWLILAPLAPVDALGEAGALPLPL